MDDYEDRSVFFIGPCTCEHEEQDHSWGSCDEPDENGVECKCEAGWEE